MYRHLFEYSMKIYKITEASEYPGIAAAMAEQWSLARGLQPPEIKGE